MTWSQIPWMVNGGRHSAALGRALAYAQSGGGEGVGASTDCKVLQSTVADNKVRIQPGVVTMLNRYGGGFQQSYIGYNPTEEAPTIPATSGSSRSDLVVARIVDPEYGGAMPADPAAGPYMFTEIITNVPSTTKRFSQLGLAYPAVELARIDRPASTATVSQGQIVDLRRLTRARRERSLQTYVMTDNEFHIGVLQTWWEVESIWHPVVEVPVWATKAIMTMTLTNLAAEGGNSFGQMRMSLTDGTTTFKTGSGLWDTNNDFAQGDHINVDVTTTSSFSVVPYQGKTLTLSIEGMMNMVMTANIFSRQGTQAIWDVEFIEGLV